MSSLSSFLSSQLKGKVALRSPFHRRNRQEEPATASLSSVHSVEGTASIDGVIEIGGFAGRRSSLDFQDSANPQLNSPDRPLYTDLAPVRFSSNRLQLQLDLSPDSEPLTDWFTTSFPTADPSPNGQGSRPKYKVEILQNVAEDDDEEYEESESDGLVTEDDALREGMKHISQHDFLATLEAMKASDFGTLSRDATPRKSQPSALTIPGHAKSQANSAFDDAPFPMTALSSPISSAVSGQTLARQLLANSYTLPYDSRLSYDSRASRYRGFSELTRSDSTTLPQEDRTFNHFSVDPAAPPIPSDAEVLYVAPKTPRTPNSARPKSLKRRGSTGSIIAIKHEGDLLASTTRPNSLVISPTESSPPLPPLPNRKSDSPPDSPPDSANDVNQQTVERRHLPPAIDLAAAQNIPQRPVRPYSQSSSSSSSASAVSSPRQVEDVLDSYYSNATSEHVEGVSHLGFRPVFTPITEESLSQLSPTPPTPYRNERRESQQRSQPIGARSPLKNPTRKRSLQVQGHNTRLSESGIPLNPSPLPVIHDRPHSAQLSSSSLHSTPSHQSLSSTESLELLPHPSLLAKIIGNRQRSGSAPSPIRVLRDPRNANKYVLSINDQTDSSPESTPTTGESEQAVQQTWPESAISNGWFAPLSPLNPPSEAVPNVPPSSIPQSAPFPGITNDRSLEQQVLLARARTTIRDRHSRQGSFSSLSNKRSASPLRKQRAAEEEDEANNSSSTIVISLEARETSSPHPPPRHSPPVRSLPPSPVEQLSRVVLATSSQELLMPPPTPHGSSSPVSVNRSTSVSSRHGGSDAASIRTQASNESSRSKIKSLPPVPPSPPPTPPASSASANEPSPALPPPSRAHVPPSLSLAPNIMPSRITALDNSASPTDSNASEDDATPLPSTPPRPTSRHPLAPRGSTNTIDAILQASLGSPPPYYTLIDVQHQTPPSQSTHGSQPFPAPQPLTLSPSQPSLTGDNSKNSEPTANKNPRDSALPGKPRLRPPGPAGPRRPTLQSMLSPIGRERSGSHSSLGSSLLRHDSMRRPSIIPASPRFQPPAVKWKGYTLEVAKWTFSSSQLQAIVSRAIRDSALSSSIRLLKLESLDGEIPAELHRLEMLRTDLKSRYKAGTRRRTVLFESLTFHMSRPGEESATAAVRAVEDLKEIALSLDAMAEDLHTADEHINQLNTLVQVHSASALSVALRKLNGSLMKQKEDSDYLRQQNIALEQERDEAWNQAQEVADEYDSNFSDKESSKRSSRISARRKSSIRLSKAGLRGQSRRQSQRSSVASSSYGGPSGTPLTSRSPFRDEIPPLPPIPQRRPNIRRPEVLTIYEPPLRSSGALSANDLTPDSETREMVRAQEELYTMLGITSPDATSPKLRRSRSMLPLPSAGLSPPPMSAWLELFMQRRSSLPGAPAFLEAQNARDADHHAVLATFATLPPDEL